MLDLRSQCVMEVFTFVQMGGQRENMPVKPLDDDCEDTYSKLLRFDAGEAQCFLPKDRDKLLAVIEASFGTFEPFNTVVRGIFKEKLSSSACRASAAAPRPALSLTR